MPSSYAPPFSITPKILNLHSEILRKIGRYEGLLSPIPQPKLRRRNTIKTVRGTLAIEGNVLSEDVVTAVIEGRRVIGPVAQVQEVKNAIAAYSRVKSLNPASESDFRDALAP